MCGDRGSHGDGDNGGGGLGWQALVGMFHRGVDEPLPFAQVDAGDFGGDDGYP